MSHLSREGGMRAADRLIGAAKRNPEGVLLLAAGCALLMRGVGAAAHALRDDHSSAGADLRTNGSRRSGTSASNVDDLASGITEPAANFAGRAKERAEELAEYAQEAGRDMYDQSSQMARQAGTSVRDAVDRMVKEQPLTIALFGLAAGAVLAGTLPTSRIEERALAPAAEGLGDVARDAKNRLRKSAAKARERMSDVAEERGLTADGLKAAAGEVAEAFGSELMAETGPARGSAPTDPSSNRPAAASSARPKSPQPSRTEGPMSNSGGNRSGDTASATDIGSRSATAMPSTNQSGRGV